jgi:hypothetical protein
MLREAGFSGVEVHPNLMGKASSEADEFFVVIAQK